MANEPTIKATNPKLKAQQLLKAYENTVLNGASYLSKTLTKGPFDLSIISLGIVYVVEEEYPSKRLALLMLSNTFISDS